MTGASLTGTSLTDSGDSGQTNFGIYNCTQICQSTIVHFRMTGHLCVLHCILKRRSGLDQWSRLWVEKLLFHMERPGFLHPPREPQKANLHYPTKFPAKFQRPTITLS